MVTLDLSKCVPHGEQGWASDKAVALKKAAEKLLKLGHTVGPWESTSPGYQFLAGCCCLKCGRIYLARYSDGKLVPEPSSRIHVEGCSQSAWVSAQEAAASLGVDLKRLRKWVRREAVQRQAFTIRNGLPSCERTGRKSAEMILAAEVEALRSRIRYRTDKLGRQYIELLKAAVA